MIKFKFKQLNNIILFNEDKTTDADYFGKHNPA